jgi:hypothetical protein
MPGHIKAKAELSVGRACGFAGLAIGTFMVGLSSDPALAFLSGGLLTLLACCILVLKANLAQSRPYKRTEVWLLLDQAERPMPEVAQVVIGRALRYVFLNFGLHAAKLAAAMLMASFLIRRLSGAG